MTRLAGAAITGAWSALRVPLWLRGRRWQELLVPPPASAVQPDLPRGVVRAARTGVRLLAAVPGLPWRDTCLYNSVAECLALRRDADRGARLGGARPRGRAAPARPHEPLRPPRVIPLPPARA